MRSSISKNRAFTLVELIYSRAQLKGNSLRNGSVW